MTEIAEGAAPSFFASNGERGREALSDLQESFHCNFTINVMLVSWLVLFVQAVSKD